MEIYEEGGVVNNDVPTILHKWTTEYENLYNLVDSEDVYNDEFFNQCKSFVDNAGDTDENSNNISDDINNLEVQTALIKAKIRKAIGIDNLPNEILKNPNTVDLLLVLFRRIYDLGFIPSIWRISILNPIPKNSMIDPRLPLQYRGISLLSTVYKLFSSIINEKITKTAENNDLYADEPNGFTVGRSCEEHVFTFSSIIRNRKSRHLSNFVAFVDMEKAFDRVNRIAQIDPLSFQAAIEHKPRQVRWGWLHAPMVTEWWPACLHKQSPRVHQRSN